MQTLIVAVLLAQAEPAVWADGLRNPVRLAVDEQGRVYVVESDSLSRAEEAPGDPASRTPADRLARLPAGKGEPSERIRRLVDADGDGRAERVELFADGFAAPAEGPAGGILARRGEVWLSCVPALWHLRDRDGDGRAEVRKPWFTGFAVRQGGSGLQGPVPGPDGKLYFAAGDRGFQVLSSEGERLEYPDMGAVLRCDLDGSNLEIFAIGLRRPRDLAFDAAGNLWVADDERLLEVLEGGDYGARLSYQGEGAAVLPAAAAFGGPTTGLAVDPGNGRFYRTDGAALRSFRLEAVDAGWTIVDEQVVREGGRPVDVEPGTDGGLFVLEAGGRILKLGARGTSVVDAFAGLETCPLEELAARMGHADLRVRLQAQQELVRRQGSTQILQEATRPGPSREARLHAVWGLGQLYTRKSLLPMLRDEDPELRAQAARVLGDRRVRDAVPDLLRALKDVSPRVRFYAALALGKIGPREAVRPLADLLRENDGRDPRLRHAGAFALALIGNVPAIEELGRHASAQVRVAALMALRRLGRPEVAAFLRDAEPAVQAEAARAIHDLPIAEALPALAERLSGPAGPEPLIRRAINAAYRVGRPDLLAAYAARPDAPLECRSDALAALGAWTSPGPRDRVTGAWRPLPDRDPGPAREALSARLAALRGDPAVAPAAERAAGVLLSPR